MTSLNSRSAETIAVRQLSVADEFEFDNLAEQSDLDGLAAPHRGKLLRNGRVWAAVDPVSPQGRRFVGCCCADRGVVRGYLDVRHQIHQLPLPNLYLCGAFVLPGYRGLGVGQTLYRTRLSWASSQVDLPIFVEINGNGKPFSVHPDALPGWRFHQRAGLDVIGYSVCPDRGPVLARPALRSP